MSFWNYCKAKPLDVHDKARSLKEAKEMLGQAENL